MQGLLRLIFVWRPAVAIACLMNKTGGGRLLVVVVLQLALGKVFGFFVRDRSFAVFRSRISIFSQAGFFWSSGLISTCQTRGRYRRSLSTVTS